MDELHQLILQNQQVMAHSQQAIANSQELATLALVFIAALTFLGAVVAAWGLYQTRGTKEMVRKAKEDSERMNYYLFGKLGPLETK